METYLAKVHSVTESKNPGLYATFVQTLIEAGEQPVNQAELHVKVKKQNDYGHYSANCKMKGKRGLNGIYIIVSLVGKSYVQGLS